MAEQRAVTPGGDPDPPRERGLLARLAWPARRGGLAAVLLLGLPLVGALVDEALSPGLGLVFGAGAVLGTAVATALASRSGWWWVLPAMPAVVLAVTAGAELLGDSAKYRDSKALATSAARWAISGFPVMLAAFGAALLVVLVRIARDKRRAREERNRRG